MTIKKEKGSDKALELLFEKHVDLDNRVVTLIGEINDPMFRLVDQALTALENQGKTPITIRLNSDGGHVASAAAIVGRYVQSICPIHIEAYGEVMSAAIFLLAFGDERRISEFTTLMWHEPSVTMEGDYRQSHLKEHFKYLQAENRKWCERLAEVTEKPARFWESKGVGRDYHFTPKIALEYGLVDEIIERVWNEAQKTQKRSKKTTRK